MSNSKIIFELSDKEIIDIDYELQNSRSELHEKTNKISFDNIIFIDNSDQAYNAQTALYQTRNNQMKDQIHFKVYDANQLYQDFKEMQKMKHEKEKEIKEIQDKHNKLEQDLNQMIIKCKDLDQTKIQFEKDNEILQSKNKELENLLLNLNQLWQNYYNQLNTQCQQIYQQQQFAIQELSQLRDSLLNQIKDLEEFVQNQKQEIEKQKKLVKQEKDKLEKANNDLSNSENIVSQQNNQMRKYEREIKQLKDKINDLEIIYRNTNNVVDDVNTTLSSKATENKKLQSENKMLNQNILQLDNDKQELINIKQQLEANSNILNQHIMKLNSDIEQSNKVIEQLKADLYKKGLDYDKQGKDLQQQKSSLDKEYQDLNNQLQQLKEEIKKQENREEDYIKEIEQLKKKVAQLVQDLIDANKQLKDKQEETRSQKKLISEKDGEITTLGLKLDQTQLQLKQKEQQIKNDKAQNDNYKYQMDDMIKMMKSESDQTYTKLKIKEYILQKLSKQIQDDKYLDKISGLMEKIMQTEYKIYQFTKDKNDHCDTEYDIFEINMEYGKAKELLKNNEYFQFEQCLTKNPRGKVTLKRSVQPNADSTFFKGYLSVVQESTQNEFKGKYLLRRDLISQNEAFTKIDEAIQISKNNFLCQLLMEQFNKVLKQQKIKEQQFNISRQFVLKSRDKEEYYYYEMVEEGEFKKINGGQLKPQVGEVYQYFNAFTLFVYAFSQENYIITNLQICGNKVYDMLVSTQYKGLFSSLDQGPHELGQFLDIIKEQPNNVIKPYWDPNVEALAQEGFK